jgi:hypothetical protein
MCGAFLPCIPHRFIFVATQSLKAYTVEFRLSGLIGTKSHPDIQKIWIIEFFFESRLRWQFEVQKMSTNGCVRLRFYLRICKTLIHNSLHEFDKWRKI